jgi:hypothetical protein
MRRARGGNGIRQVENGDRIMLAKREVQGVELATQRLREFLKGSPSPYASVFLETL